MRKLSVLFVLFSAVASAQRGAPEPDTETIAAMEKISFLFGEWEGTGWAAMGPGARRAFTIKESIHPRAGGTVVSLAGIGKDTESGSVSHDAFAVLTYDKGTKKYNLRSYIVNGQHGDFPVQVGDEKIVWEIKAERHIRYTITLDEKGQWVEKGEIKMGKDWFQFLEMTLKKVK